MIELNIAAITETTAEKATRLKREAHAAAELPRIEKFMREEHIRRYPNSPEARKARREKADREFFKSIELRSDVPPITEADMVRGRPLWRPLGTSEAERKAAEEKAWKDSREVGEIVPIPDPETR